MNQIETWDLQVFRFLSNIIPIGHEDGEAHAGNY